MKRRPLDFAYTIHTEVGHTCVGAKVNGRIVPLRYKLRSGDIVEILTQPGHTPSRDWLTIVKSPRSRQKIKHWLNIHQRERAIEIGRKLIDKEAPQVPHCAEGNQRRRTSARSPMITAWARVTSCWPALATESSLRAASSQNCTPRLTPRFRCLPKKSRARVPSRSVVRRVFGCGDGSALKVTGHDDLLVYRARCCNPIRGEEIVGYVTRGKGVAVHSRNCPNVHNLLYEPERRIAVEWAREAHQTDRRCGLPGEDHRILR